MDICLADARLSLLNGVNGRASTLPYDSDHTAITSRFGLGNDGFNFATCAPARHRLNYKATKWKKFAKKIAALDNITIPEDRNLTIPEIDEYVQKISTLISKSASIVVPKIKANDNTLQYVNRKIRKLQKRKSQLVSLLHYLHIMDPDLRLPASRQAKELLKYTVKELRSEFRIAIENFWTRLVKKIDHRNPASFFPKINALFRPKHLEGVKDLHISRDKGEIIQRSRCDTSQSVILGNDFIISDSQDKLNIIGAFYESINSPRPLNSGTRLKQIVDNAADKLKSELCTRREQFITISQFNINNMASNPASLDNAPHPFCDIASINYILKNLPNKTSSGLDNIPPILLKHLPAKTIRDLTVLLNNAINHNYFPVAWKKAKVLPILKKGKNPHDPSHYRPISLTPSLSKVYESVINDSIASFCSDNKVIPDHQFGFKNRHSTIHAVHKLLADLNTQVGNCKLVGAALLDLEKAFDSVWLNGLIFKLLNKNFPKWLVLTIWDMIRDKSFVTWDGINISSEEFMITEELQQGTVDSPILFNIFTSDLTKLFGLNAGMSSALAFADDVIVYTVGNRVATVRDNLESLVDKLNKYYMTWNLRLNPDKCETILFRKPINFLSTKARAGSNQFQIKTLSPGTNNSVNIPHKKTLRYLGVQLDYLLRGNKHIEMQADKARMAFMTNSRVFYNKNITNRAKVILYMLLVRPILTYAAPIWWNCNHTVMEKLRCLERRCLRACLRLYRSQYSDWQHYIRNQAIYETAEIPRIDSFTLRLTRDYFSGLPNIDNAVIRSSSMQRDEVSKRQITIGYVAPQAFTYCDQRGLLQNECNIPILYHWKRNKANKKIALKHDAYDTSRGNFTFSIALPKRDRRDFHRLNFEKYWWLSPACAHIPELLQRRVNGA